MAGVSESHRQRIAFLLLGIGFLLIIIGFALLTHRDPQELPPTTRAAAVAPQTRALAMQQMLFYLVVLVIVFAVSTMAFLRWSRHYRRSLLRKPSPPTPSEDVWAMHKLPEGAIDEWTDTDPEAGEERRE